jgi:hypothetical protein
MRKATIVSVTDSLQLEIPPEIQSIEQKQIQAICHASQLMGLNRAMAALAKPF